MVAGNHVRGYLESRLAEVTVVYDSNPSIAAALAAQVGARVAESLADLASSVEASSVCVPPGAHLEVCTPLLRAGVAVLCEKPFETTKPRATRLLAEVQKTGTPLMVGFTQRFYGPMLQAKKLIDRGVLGSPVLFKSSFGANMDIRGGFRADPEISGGGCLSDTASHSVDLFRWFMGEAVSVSAQTHAFTEGLEVEDFGVVKIQGGDGRCGLISATSYLPVFPNELEVICENGILRLNYYTPGIPELSIQKSIGKPLQPVKVPAAPYKFAAQAREFLRCVRNGEPPTPGAVDGFENTRILSAAYESAKGSRTVLLNKAKT